VRAQCNRCQAPREEPRHVAAPPPQYYPAFAREAPRHAPAPQPHYAVPLREAPGQASQRPSGAPIAGVDGNWECIHCGNVNFAVRAQCNRCQAPREEPRHVAAPPPQYYPAPRHGPAPQPHYPVPLREAPRQASQRPSGAPIAGLDGNWECPECHNVNFASRDACNRCGAPRGDTFDDFGPPPPQKVQHPPAVHAQPPLASAHRGGAPTAGVDGNWECFHCGNVNFATRSHCNRCQAPRQAPPQAPPQHSGGSGGAPRAGVDGNWLCPECQNVNFPTRTVCNRCQAPKPVDHLPHRGKGGAPVAGVRGNWACLKCQNVNFGGRMECNRCQEPKPEELMSDDALLEHLSQPAEFDEPLAKRARFG